MASASTPREVGRVSDAAVLAKTGRVWSEWFSLLDGDGATGWTHRAIAAHVAEQYQVDGWWAQTVTVEYERERGLREKYQKSDGYSASGSRTVGVPVDVLYATVSDRLERGEWPGELVITVRKATANRSIRASVAEGSNLDIMFYVKGAGKSQITIQHDKLPDAESVTRLKAFWAAALDRLKAELTGA